MKIADPNTEEFNSLAQRQAAKRDLKSSLNNLDKTTRAHERIRIRGHLIKEIGRRKELRGEFVPGVTDVFTFDELNSLLELDI